MRRFILLTGIRMNEQRNQHKITRTCKRNSTKKQIELADFLSINKATYGRIESGAVSITPERLEKIAGYLDFPVDFFLLQTIPSDIELSGISGYLDNQA